MTQQLLQQLVEMRGIETQYVDAWGKPATIAESTAEAELEEPPPPETGIRNTSKSVLL